MQKNNIISITLDAKTEEAKSKIDKTTLSLQKLSKVAKTIGGLSIFGITTWKALQNGIKGCYEHSEKFQASINKLQKAGIDAIAPKFRKVGDVLSKVVNTVGSWIEHQNKLSGVIAETNAKNLEAIQNNGTLTKENIEQEIKLHEELGANSQLIEAKKIEGLHKINDIIVKSYADAIELEKKYKNEIEETEKLLESYSKDKGVERKYHNIKETLAKLKQDHEKLVNEILPNLKEEYKQNNVEIAKNTKSVKIESDALASILARTKQINVEHRFMTKYTEDEEQITQENLKKYQSQLAIIKNINSVYNSGEKIKTATLNKIAQEFDMSVDLFKTEKGRVEIYEEILKKIKEIEEGQNKINEAMLKSVQQGYEWMGVISQVHSMSSSIASLSLSSKLIDTSIYDKAISEVKAKITEFNKWKEAMEEEEDDKEDAEFEVYLERLNKEYEIAKEIGDKMTMLAIENKKKELDKQKETLEKEKQITAQEKALEKELAIAEYNKAYAEWQNECMIAEQTKQMNLAEAIIQPLQAAAYAALGIAQSFATGGPIGAAIAAASSIGIISSAVSTAAAYKNSAQQLDSVKASPPEPPAFRFGTAGYQLKEGEQAIVGEAGAEIIKNMAGKLVVESNAQAKASGKLNGVGMYVETVIFNVNSIVDKQTIFKAMNEYKERNSFAYTR